jgi:DNA primase small subunit
MTDKTYLTRLFKAYYRENQSGIPAIDSFEQREFGFIPWDKQMMIRHTSFKNLENLVRFLIDHGPKHTYSSGTLYLKPDNPDMSKKEYQGCDLIVDIDVDHFYTPCKDDHDQWQCKECGKSGKGMEEKCPKCGKRKLSTLTWICEKCLNIAKNEIVKLVYDFLIPDFGIKEEDMKITFSGHRGYHLKIENKDIRMLSSDERRDIADYISGQNISFEILGLREIGGIIYGIFSQNMGWSQKIIKKIQEFLKKPNVEIENLMNSFLKYKDDFLDIISNNKSNIWAIEGFGINTWKKFLEEIVKEIGINIDEPVTVDIHRLIRYPGTLHGATGFKVQDLELNELENFSPLNENKENLDPIVFKSENIQKIEITESFVPATKISDIAYGPFKKGDKVEVPHHIAVFLLCKGVAKTL